MATAQDPASSLQVITVSKPAGLDQRRSADVLRHLTAFPGSIVTTLDIDQATQEYLEYLGRELSPATALRSRFVIVNADDSIVGPTASAAAVLRTLQYVASAAFSSTAGAALLAAHVCALICSNWEQHNPGQKPYDAPITVGTVCRMLDSAHALQHHGIHIAVSLWHAWRAVVGSAIRHPGMAADLSNKVQKLLFGGFPAPTAIEGKMAICWASEELANACFNTSWWSMHGEAVAAAVACRHRVLLEGRPAVGCCQPSLLEGPLSIGCRQPLVLKSPPAVGCRQPLLLEGGLQPCSALCEVAAVVRTLSIHGPCRMA